jgi:hypothetical protein
MTSETHYPVDSVLLIDGDNDPHLPPEFKITDNTLARVFLRPQAKMPRGLEKKLGHLPMCVAVVSPKGGANAADFVMSLHAGMLHAVLPMSVPFTLVTNDKSLAAMVQELQRVGRMTSLWTSHPDRREQAAAAEQKPSRRGRRPGPRGRGRPAKRAAKPEATLVTGTPEPTLTASPEAPAASAGKSLEETAAAYAARLGRIKDPPSRLKTLLNDIKNRSVSSGFSPEAILEELKRAHGLRVDDAGRVQRG